ncbi:MAG: PHP domain-containing protein [Elusimicrobiaceae bacterium]|nr:PHP domain-containing protein [Elusimicrobiaceae bacterium]
MLKVDLHTHSTFSDGTSSPEEVVCAAAKAGVKVFALADHDTTDGVLRAQAACQKYNIDWVCAVEISTREHDHLHFLGYNVDIHNAAFQNFLKTNRENRVNRIKKIIRQLADSGVDITEEDVFTRTAHTISRAHVADALKKKKIVPNRQEGFRKYLVPGQVGYVPSAGVTVIEAIYEIKKAGGLAVIAHPGLTQEVWNFPAWVEAGLDGIEVFYPSHSYTLKQELLKIARKYDLFATAGSDYHGPNAGRITSLGMNLQAPYSDRLLRKLLGK